MVLEMGFMSKVIHNIIASTDPGHTPAYVLVHTTYHPAVFNAIERELEYIYSTFQEAEKHYQKILSYDQNVYTTNSLRIKIRDLRFGEGLWN